MGLYPPIVQSSLPAFSADTSQVKFYFQLPQMMNKDDLNNTSIQYTVVNQRNNKSVLNAANMENGYAIINPSEYIEEDNSKYYFYIKKDNILNKQWVPSTIYKVQIRFTNIYEHSEWSTVCYLKATGLVEDITVNILNIEGDNATIYVESPVFIGQYIPAESDNSELQKRYKFILQDITGEELENTGWKPHTAGGYDRLILSSPLENFKKYQLIYSIETKNGYTRSITKNFLCTFGLLETPDIEFKELNMNKEEGYIKLNLSSKNKYSTNLILRRTDSKSNFTIWEDYQIFNIWDEVINIDFIDYLIEHGVQYKYSIQSIDEQGKRGTSVYSEITETVYYDHMFLVGNGKQLKIKYNPKIQSYKRTLQEAKVDTIGSKYPFIARNGNVNYFTFPISGLISYHMDEAQTFCPKNLLCVPGQITTVDESRATCKSNQSIANQIQNSFNENNVNLDNENIFAEREFRKYVEEFLTNGDYKYFKSPTEGIKLIALMGVSLTPNDTVGRMLYTFNSTAHEIGDNSLSKALELGIQSKGEFIASENMGTKDFSGLVFDVNVITADQKDLFATIKKLVEGKVEGTNYSKKLEYLKDVRIEVLNRTNATIEFIQGEDKTKSSIIIGSQLGYYIFPKPIKIYGLNCKEFAKHLKITYTAVCSYVQDAETKDNIVIDKNANIVSQFAQVYQEFNATSTKDLFKVFLNTDPSITKIYSFNYLRVDAAPGTMIKINGKEQVIGEDMSREYNMVITSAEMVSDAVASITVIYNGVKQ